MIVRSISAAFLLSIVPIQVFAATLTFEAPSGSVAAGDTVIVRAYLDATESLNALDATLSLRDSTAQFEIQEVSRSGSALSIWPTNPILADDKKELQLTAGAPGGISSQHALVTSLVLKLLTSGTITVRTSAVQAYADDGKGTIVPVASVPIMFEVSSAHAGATVRNDWSMLVSNDTTPPEPFTLTLGSDPSVFDGKKFITFGTTDAESGVDRYEVVEGSASPVVSTGTYVLVNQESDERLTVSAYDKAGNVRVVQSDVGGQYTLSWSIVAVFLLLFVVLSIIHVRRKKHA